VSPLNVLGTFGAVLSTVVMLPHLVHAIRRRQPSGAPLAWFVGALTGGTWSCYGIASGDLLIATPNLISVPANLILCVWSIRAARSSRHTQLDAELSPTEQATHDVAYLEALYAAKAAHPAGRRNSLAPA
jgi:uncharacterized protein with PQ loop repeat